MRFAEARGTEYKKRGILCVRIQPSGAMLTRWIHLDPYRTSCFPRAVFFIPPHIPQRSDCCRIRGPCHVDCRCELSGDQSQTLPGFADLVTDLVFPISRISCLMRRAGCSIGGAVQAIGLYFGWKKSNPWPSK